METKEFARKVNVLGCDYLDAPVSGGEVGAKAATLTIMVGGPERAFAAVKPLFELMGKNVTLVGGNGDGQTTKVANQIIVALTIEAVGEALLFASTAGADPARVRQALMGGFAASRILEVHGERMVTRNFEPGFRIELHQKDLNLALQGARTLGISLPNTATRRWCRCWSGLPTTKSDTQRRSRTPPTDLAATKLWRIDVMTGQGLLLQMCAAAGRQRHDHGSFTTLGDIVITGPAARRELFPRHPHCPTRSLTHAVCCSRPPHPACQDRRHARPGKFGPGRHPPIVRGGGGRFPVERQSRHA
jgi:hypothetical protein